MDTTPSFYKTYTLKIFDTLYKRTSTGAIQFWEISVQDADTEMNERAFVTKKSGQLGTTSPLININEVKEGKQKRNYLQQALSEAESDWRRKKDGGYKSLSDLKITNHGDYVSKNGQDLSLAEMLGVELAEFNTDASGNVLPMLAPSKPWKAGDKKNKYPKQMETKFDGVRATCVIDVTKKGNHKTSTIKMLSRSGKPYDTVGHILQPLVDANIFPVGTTILDGEIYKHGWALSEINRAVKKYRPGITEQLEFWIYDLPLYKGNQSERTNAVVKYLGQIQDKSIQLVTGLMVTNDAQVKAIHDEWVKAGYEGAILKDPAGTYQQGQRSSYWNKVKMFDETEFEIIGGKIDKIALNPDLEYGVTDKMVDSFTFTCTCKGGEFDVKPKGSRETRAEYINDLKNLIGKQLTVKHFGYTEYNIPFLPIGKAVRDYE